MLYVIHTNIRESLRRWTHYIIDSLWTWKRIRQRNWREAESFNVMRAHSIKDLQHVDDGDCWAAEVPRIGPLSICAWCTQCTGSVPCLGHIPWIPMSIHWASLHGPQALSSVYPLSISAWSTGSLPCLSIEQLSMIHRLHTLSICWASLHGPQAPALSG